jgi:hypothetical protein
MILFHSKKFFRKVTSIKFHENPSSGSGCDTCRQKDERQELAGAFRYYGNATKNFDQVLRRISGKKRKVKNWHEENPQ